MRDYCMQCDCTLITPETQMEGLCEDCEMIYHPEDYDEFDGFQIEEIIDIEDIELE